MQIVFVLFYEDGKYQHWDHMKYVDMIIPTDASLALLFYLHILHSKKIS
jgi:hypothetical protein